ncbi:Fe2+-dependent dioxygenase [Prochlorococcus sp. MIT 0801]|uniref:Fe2+-dependent dioxygenase n=1 Tax=Prochlorococcus sp. MIT 0801 TaxID=1501269 RepID=UPI0004F67E49|nr:Fe2+-dependent dioxygenase [Prochlorococcus sp. MIT 0801]AIQ97729.1 Iron-uptake factor PiuC [Prochlorococcus sp. MIT 0801]
MIYFAHKFLNDETHKDLRKRLLISSDWQDGIYSALGNAKETKRNLELAPGESHENFSNEIIEAFIKDDFLQFEVFPSKIFGLLFSRTGPGMYYKPHVDAIYQYGGEGRRDLSFTIFLNQPDEYKGGELVLNIPPEKKNIKLNAGEMIIYPTKYLHEVKEVIEGERMVCVGWIESQIADNEDRETLSMLRKGFNEIVQTHGISSSTMKLMIAINNIHKRFIS